MDPSEFPQLQTHVAERDPRGRRRQGLTQSHMDTLLGRTAGTYERLERGVAVRAALLKETARILRLTTDEWHGLWAFAFSEQPPSPLDKSVEPTLADRWQWVLDAQSSMAVIIDAEGHTLAYNEPFAGLFGEEQVPADLMRWTLFDPRAREVLADWPTHWAPYLLAKLRTALALHGESQGLNGLLQEVLADADTTRLYEAAGAATSVASDATPFRPLRHPTFGDGWMTVCAAGPLDAPGVRLYFASFTKELPGRAAVGDRPGSIGDVARVSPEPRHLTAGAG